MPSIRANVSREAASVFTLSNSTALGTAKAICQAYQSAPLALLASNVAVYIQPRCSIRRRSGKRLGGLIMLAYCRKFIAPRILEGCKVAYFRIPTLHSHTFTVSYVHLFCLSFYTDNRRRLFSPQYHPSFI